MFHHLILCAPIDHALLLLQAQLLLISVLLFTNPSHGSSEEWLLIDCGTRTSYTDGDGLRWQTDVGFISTGENNTVEKGVFVTATQSTRRFFPTLLKNCYTINTPEKVKYLIRAGFYYGNYDGLSRPPTFDLVIDANKWVTVNTSSPEPVLHEIVYATKGDNFLVCLARTRPEEVPFISSLEVVPLATGMYSKMNRNYAWYLSHRVRFGGSDVVSPTKDDYNREWNPYQDPSLVSVAANFSSIFGYCADDPPLPVILNAAEPTAGDASNAISLSFEFPANSSRTNYVALYFTEVIQRDDGETREFVASVDGKEYGLEVSPEYQICSEVNVTTEPAAGDMKIELTAVSGSSLPPLICAAEIYTVGETLLAGSNEDDVNGVEEMKKSFSRLQAWTGDPCLPNNTVWEWLGCNANDPPRVRAIYLSGYGLEAGIPNFGQMQALEIIYMDNNLLSGSIPDFLGNLPNLRELNLAYNQLSGRVPESLLSNNKLNLNLTGNPLLTIEEKHMPHWKKAIWSVIAVVVIIVVVGVCCCSCHGESDSRPPQQVMPRPPQQLMPRPVSPPAPEPQQFEEVEEEEYRRRRVRRVT
ncbi:probable LRR receptor-like serine/threonine-protein kinase MEE39 [Zingiber officinale]|uniref:probable LRR receptor-like serine/threonine-protein kinase MEE39 n=1 Tax=Zingiber officinale TaxID=94328 RepID=UPI001C4C1B9A|nr:probable LRR receptor-like serine/threonine-protein kinase MEE39 [Zingiber officinale]